MEHEGMQPSEDHTQSDRRGIFNSIRNKLITALLAVGIIPLVLGALFSYVYSRNVLRTSVESELESVVSLTEDRIERWFAARRADAETYSAMQFATGDSEDVLDLGLAAITSLDGSRTAELAARNVMEDILRATGATYDAIYLTDTNGQVRVGTKRVPAEEDGEDTYQRDHHERHTFGADDFFIEARRNPDGYYRSNVISYTYDGDEESITTIFIVHTVSDAATGEYAGAIVLEVSPAELQSLVEDFSSGNGKSYLQSGGFLVSSRQITPLPEESESLRLPNDEAGTASLRGFSNENVLASWRTNPLLNYVVYAQIPSNTALSDINGLGVIMIGMVVIFIALVAAVAYFFAREVAKPILKLTHAAREIALGNLDTRVAVTSTDELGLLADAFNNMTNNLHRRVYGEKQNREYLEEVLNSYMKFVERVSRGDLTARLSLNGQEGPNLIVAKVDADQDDNLLRLGYNLNRMVEALHSMASQTRDVARSLSEAALQILDSSTQQISSATQQDAAVSQTTSTVAEVRATVAETAERAQMVAEAAQQSVEISRQGQHAVAETIEGMNVIRSRVESIAENILMLSERTTQIGDIIATVNAIADQSKMLALNASIEAARAGEEGRGFAVVAMEVRNLAEQSREATAQVRDILSEIQQATNTAVMVTEEGTKGVDLGVQLVDRAGRAIRELAGKLEDASQSAMQIAASTRQQSQAMDQLTSAMSSIKASTSLTATSMQNTQRNAKDLNEMARQMEAAISAYKL